MTLSAEALADLLLPLRESCVTALLEAQARAIESGADVESEPIRRDPDGAVWRGGVLALPERADLSIRRDGRTLVQNVEVEKSAGFRPCELSAATRFSAVLAPFQWNRAPLTMSTTLRQPYWAPLRRWYLEWFQSRPTELSPELAGAVHSLQGPTPGRFGWQAVIDFGSAPVTVIAALLSAVAETGSSSVTIGSRRT